MEAPSEESLNKLTKPEIVAAYMNLQTKMTKMESNMINEERKLNGNLEKPQSELDVTKNVNILLSDRLTSLERQCWANAQYSRRECVEISGIPKSVEDNALESTLCKIFDKVGMEINQNHIEACHRVGRQGNAIVKFTRRKDCQHLLKIKKDLSKLTFEDINLARDTKIFVNQSLCAYYRVLWSKSKALHKMGLIFGYFVSNGTIKIRKQENGPTISITYVSDFEKYFPGVNLSPTR